MTHLDPPPANQFTITITTETLPNGQMFSVIDTDVSAHEQVATLTTALAEALEKTEYTPQQEEQMLRWIIDRLGIQIQARPLGDNGPFVNIV